MLAGALSRAGQNWDGGTSRGGQRSVIALDEDTVFTDGNRNTENLPRKREIEQPENLPRKSEKKQPCIFRRVPKQSAQQVAPQSTR